jgi:serine/threonine-protein kinase
MTATGSSSTLSGTFGKYKPIAVLGRGGMATVFLAAATGPAGFTKLVVVKELKPELAEDPEFMAMFLDEARLAARLSHPNIVQTYEVSGEAGRHAIVMEYLDGQPLSRIRSKIAEFGDKGEAVMLRIIADALAGLHHAHELKDYDGSPLSVVHRDISPHNVFITYDGQAKVVDFGIAKAADTVSQTRVGVIKGKLSYMSPEQASALPVDRRADVFAAGVMIWESVVGLRLWKGLEEVAVMHRLITGEIPRIKEMKPNASPLIDQICARALAVRAADRYATAEELRQHLELYLAQSAVKVDSRQVGEIVGKVFEEDRKKIRGVIEEQLRAMRGSPTSASVSSRDVAKLPQLGPNHTGTPSASQASAFSVIGPMVTPPSPGIHAASQRRTSLWIGLAGIAIAIGALSVAAIMVSKRTQTIEPLSTGQPTATTPVVTQTTTGTATQVAPSMMHVTVSVQPVKAKVTIDGKPVDGPIQAVADGSKHELKIEAPGYATQTQTLTYDHDLAIPVALEKKTAGGRPVGASPTVKPGATGEEDPLGF